MTFPLTSVRLTREQFSTNRFTIPVELTTLDILRLLAADAFSFARLGAGWTLRVMTQLITLVTASQSFLASHITRPRPLRASD